MAFTLTPEQRRRLVELAKSRRNAARLKEVMQRQQWLKYLREEESSAKECVGRCRMLQPGCHRFFLRHPMKVSRHRRLACSNPKCVARQRYLYKLLDDRRITRDEFRAELDSYIRAAGFRDASQAWPRAERVRFYWRHVEKCGFMAKGCQIWAYRWRKDRLWGERVACGADACRKKAWERYRRRRRRQGAEAP